MYNILVQSDNGLIKDYNRDYILTNNTIVVLLDGDHILTYSDLSSATCNVHQIEDELELFYGNKYIYDNGNITIVEGWEDPEPIEPGPIPEGL